MSTYGVDYPDPYDPGPEDNPALDEVLEEQIRFNQRVEDELRHLRIRKTALDRLRAEEDQHDPGAFDSEYLDADQLTNLPRPDPIIDGVLNRHSYAILRGRDGTYKTFVALDWALCVATGKPWQGRDVERCRVLYIAGEGAYGIATRKVAWEYAWHARVEPAWFTMRQSAVNLYKGGPALEDLIARINTDGYGLVVVDTLRRSSGGAEGNGSDMGVVVDNLERIKRATADGSVLTLTHTDKGDNDTRGFSGIEDDADIVWHAKRDEERHAMALDLRNTKMKDGPDGRTFELTMGTVLDSLVVLRQEGRATVDELQATDQAVLETMRESFAHTGATVTQLHEVSGMSRSTLYKATGRLTNDGRLRVTKRGPSSVFTITETGVESVWNPGVDSTPDSTPSGSAFHTTAEHDSTPFHADSTPVSTPFHAHPPALRQGGCGIERNNTSPDTTNDTTEEAS